MPAQNTVAAFVAAPLRAYIQAKKGLKQNHQVTQFVITKSNILTSIPKVKHDIGMVYS